jgi:RNA polymerase sigma factor (sigma-70 family)
MKNAWFCRKGHKRHAANATCRTCLIEAKKRFRARRAKGIISVPKTFEDILASKTTRIGSCLQWTGAVSGGSTPVCRLEGKSVTVRKEICLRNSRIMLPNEMIQTTCSVPLCMVFEHFGFKRRGDPELIRKAVNEASRLAGLKRLGPNRFVEVAIPLKQKFLTYINANSYSALRRMADPEDIWQEVLIKLYILGKSTSAPLPECPEAFIITIAKRTYIDQIRKFRLRAGVEVHPSEPEEFFQSIADHPCYQPLNILCAAASYKLINSRLHTMLPLPRIAIRLAYEGLSQKEIAHEMQVSEHKVENYLVRARKELTRLALTPHRWNRGDPTGDLLS